MKRRKTRKRIEEIIAKNLSNFPLFPPILPMSKLEKDMAREILGWPKNAKVEWQDILALFPGEILPPKEFLQQHIVERLENDKDPQLYPKYILEFTKNLVPVYTFYGYEGAEDFLPYSPFGYDPLEVEEAKEWDPDAKIKIPTVMGEGILVTLLFLKESGILII